MGNVFVEVTLIRVDCPGEAQCNIPVTLIGRFKYSLVNNSDNDAMFSTLAAIVDSAEHRMDHAENFFVVRAGERQDFDIPNLFLNTEYQVPGKITVTANLTIEGAVFFSGSSESCEFVVT